MNEEKFTPGPWVADTGPGARSEVYIRQNGGGKAICSGYTDKPKDIALICAAPEMFDTLDRIQKGSAHERWRNEIAQVLAKAQGEAPPQSAPEIAQAAPANAVWPENNDENLKQVFKDVEYVVMANSFERDALRWDWCERPKYGQPPVTWKDDGCGVSIHIGDIYGKPVVIEASYALVGGKRVLFYDDISRFVDHDMIIRFINYCVKKFMNGKDNLCQAGDFHRCIHKIGSAK